MKIFPTCATLVAGLTILTMSPASAAEWNDGVLFTSVEVTANQIEFGLAPGKCVGPLTAPMEALRVTEGKLHFTYPDKVVERVASTFFLHVAGEEVTKICNVGEGNAVIVGIQFRPVETAPTQ